MFGPNFGRRSSNARVAQADDRGDGVRHGSYELPAGRIGSHLIRASHLGNRQAAIRRDVWSPLRLFRAGSWLSAASALPSNGPKCRNRNSWPESTRLKLKRFAPFLSEADIAHLVSTGIGLIGSFALSYAKQRDHSHRFRNVKHRLHFVFEKSLHRRGVITEHLGHPHHRREGNHCVSIDPHGIVRRDAHGIAGRFAKYAVYSLFDLAVLLFAEAVSRRFSENIV